MTLSNRSVIVLSLATVLTACAQGSSPDETPATGSTAAELRHRHNHRRVDGGVPDADAGSVSSPDAGTPRPPDAGTPRPDAGTRPDAGSAGSPDAATPRPPDAGVTTPPPPPPPPPPSTTGDPPALNPDLSQACVDGAATFFVAPTGSDSAAGRRATPWKTIQHALDTLTPGQTACVMAGSYAESPSITRSGAAGQYISIVGLDATRTATITGESQFKAGAAYVRYANLKFHMPSRNTEAITVLGASNLQFVNIEVLDSNKVWLSSATNVLIRAAWLHHNNIGIDCTPGPCDSINIVDSIFECTGFDTSQTCAPATSFSWGGAFDGIGGEANTHDWLILRSIFRNNQSDGLDLKGTNIHVVQSQSYGNSGGGFKIWGGGLTRVENSLSFRNHNGLEFYEAAGADYQVVNTTSSDNNYSALSIYTDNGTFPTQLELHNSIFAFSAQGNTYDDFVTMTGSNNLYWLQDASVIKGGSHDYTAANVTAGTTPDHGSIAADPKFVSHVANNITSDYHLAAGSPALNSADLATATTVDLSGTARPQGSGPDRGCYEQ